jgi:hypothetical protein
MGFWHTGYFEFHEPTGFGDWQRIPPVYACGQCNQTFDSPDALRAHRFETHSLRRPVLIVREREVGTHPLRVTTSLKAAHIKIEGCDRALLNGHAVPIDRVPSALASFSSDVVQLILERNGVEAVFELDFRIASTSDLEGVEETFRKTTAGRKLNVRTVEAFISAASPFRSAIGYCDGICTYLYGVMAREGTRDSSLPYEAYGAKFAKAAEELSAYERPLARMIGSLVEFHFNHFRDAARLVSAASRIGSVSARYATWVESRRSNRRHVPAATTPLNEPEACLTDRETELILHSASQPLTSLANDHANLTALLNKEVAEFDKVKIRMLLAEAFSAIGDADRALQHAKALRNLPALEHWSEDLIHALSRNHNA